MAAPLSQPPSSEPAVVAAILAGGRGKRFGGLPKATLRLGGRNLIDWVATAIGGQTSATIFSIAPDYADAAWVRTGGLPTVVDTVPDRGPLAAVASLLAWTQQHLPNARTVMTVPVDAPFLPADLITRLTEDDALCVAESAARRHYTIAAWPVRLADDVARAVDANETALGRFQDAHAARYVSWRTEPFDPFFNINTPEDLSAAERIAVLAADRAPRRFA